MTLSIRRFAAATLIATAALLSACVTTQEPAPVVEKPIAITPPPVASCTPQGLLTRQVIPAEYKEGFHITGFENPPEYRTNPETGEVEEIQAPPTERTVPFKTLIKPEQVIFINDEGRVVEDVCNPDGSDPDEVGLRDENGNPVEPTPMPMDEDVDADF